MRNFLFMSLAVLSLSAAAGYYYESAMATCTGSSSCKACKNCKYCKHCSVRGNSCGVCR